MKRLILWGLVITSPIFGLSVSQIKKDLRFGTERVKKIARTETQEAQKAINDLLDVRQKALQAIAEDKIKRSDISRELLNSRQAILFKLSQLKQISQRDLTITLDLTGFRDRDAAGKAQILIERGNSLLDVTASNQIDKQLAPLFDLRDTIIEFKYGNPTFVQDNPDIETQLDRISNDTLVLFDSTTLPARDKDTPKEVPDSMPLEPSPALPQDESILPPPPLPRDAPIPAPPPLPSSTKSSPLPTQPSDLLSEIRQGKELQKTPEQSKDQGLLQQIREGHQLKPVAEKDPKTEKKDDWISRRRDALREDVDDESDDWGDESESDMDYEDFSEMMEKQKATDRIQKPTPPPLPPRPSQKPTVPKERPKGDKNALLESIRAGKPLKKTETQGTASEEKKSSLEEAILRQKERLEKEEQGYLADSDSDYEEGDWD